jgi:hypothetical protein
MLHGSTGIDFDIDIQESDIGPAEIIASKYGIKLLRVVDKQDFSPRERDELPPHLTKDSILLQERFDLLCVFNTLSLRDLPKALGPLVEDSASFSKNESAQQSSILKTIQGACLSLSRLMFSLDDVTIRRCAEILLKT